MADELPFYLAQNQGLRQCSSEDELLHTAANAKIDADSLTETQYVGFSVPEHKIHALCYLWYHPNLRVVTGGLYVFRGIKRLMVAAELCDMRAFMRDTAIQNDLHSYRLDNGYGVTVVDPLKKLHVTYSDPNRGNSVDLHYSAIAPPVMFGDGNHFEQPMKVTGELVLRGQKYAVDCFNVRDRSWGKPRPEHVMPLPPMSWMTGVFDNTFAFNCNVFDQIDDSTELNGRFQMPEGRHLNGGWVYRHGVMGRIVRATKRVVREPESFVPLTVVLDMVDEHDRTFSIQGTLVAACPWQVWPNLIFQVSLMRWECDGMVTHGDCQDGLWNDYLQYSSRT